MSEVAPARAELAARLRERRPEIERAIFDRVIDLGESSRELDPAYVAGVREAVAAAVACGLEVVEKGIEAPVPVPPEVARQARRAAREGVPLDVVLRRYAAGSKSLEEFILADAGEITGRVVCQVLSDQGVQIDRLMKFVSAQYGNELESASRSLSQREADRILYFLESSSRAYPDVDYEFDAWHVGMILTDPTEFGLRLIRSVAERLACQILEVPRRDPGAVWVWLGRPASPDMKRLTALLEKNARDRMEIALGEPRQGLDGWRQTIREAQAAFQVMLYRSQPITRCRDVILVAAVLRDPPLAASLIETYLAPLDGRSNSGDVLRETLRMYFRKDQNAKTAAVALGVDRHTVERRLRSVEERLGQALDTCGAQLLIALGAEELLSSRS